MDTLVIFSFEPKAAKFGIRKPPKLHFIAFKADKILTNRFGHPASNVIDLTSFRREPLPLPSNPSADHERLKCTVELLHNLCPTVIS